MTEVPDSPMLLLFHLFSLFLLVLLGFYIFVLDPRGRANQTFGAFIAFLALWTTKDLVFWNFEDPFLVWNHWAAASFVVALLMQWSLAIFAWVFPENRPIPIAKALVLFAPGVVLIPTAITGMLWRSVNLDESGFVIETAPLVYIYVGYVYVVFGYGAFILLRKYSRYRNSQRGQQVGAILWGLGITGLLKTLANIVLPFFGIYELLPYSTILALPGVFVYAYAITNFKLFSIQTALDQFRLFPITWKVALSIAIVAIVSFAIFQVPIVWWAFEDGPTFEAWRRYLVFSLISALVPNLLLVLLIVRTISRPLQRITVAAVRVTEGEYGTEVNLRNTNDEIGLLSKSFNEMSRKMADDIKTLKELNRQLLRTEKLAAMGTLSAGVAHEVNNPLASISSLIQMMQKNDSLDSAAQEKLGHIASQVSRIKQVTQNMMDFAKVRSSEFEPVKLTKLLSESIELARFDQRFLEITFTENYEPEIANLTGDADQLKQVFLNLLLNSRDAVQPNGEIAVTAASEKGGIAITFEDDGSGFDEAVLPKIFDPFYTTKSAGKGTGLGLAVCYGIVTAHGGSIIAENRSQGGARIRIWLPLVEHGEQKLVEVDIR